MNDYLSGFDFAGFLSYSSTDSVTVRWLHRRLERYVVPKSLRIHIGGRKRLGKFFRDREDLPAAPILSEQIQAALLKSQRLLVICSPEAAESKWVNEEILRFRSLGRDANVLAVIANGDPPACFPNAFHASEPIAADLRVESDGKEVGFLKLVAGIIGVSFGVLRDREAKASRERKALLIALLVVFVLLFVGSIVGLTGSLIYSKKASQLALAAISTSGVISDEAMSLAHNSRVDSKGLQRLITLSDESLEKLYAYGIETSELKQRHAWTVLRAAQAMLWNGKNPEAQSLAQKALNLSVGSESYSNHLTVGGALIVMSEVDLRAGNTLAALDYAKRSVSEMHKLSAAQSPNAGQARLALAESLGQLGSAELACGQRSNAIAAQYQALEYYRQLYSEQPDSATFPMKISEVAQSIAKLEALTGNVNGASSMYIESSRSYMAFLAWNVGRRDLHQEGLRLAIDSARYLFGVGRKSEAVEMLENGEAAMAILWSKDMTDEPVMQNLERIREMVGVAKMGQNPFEESDRRLQGRRR